MPDVSPVFYKHSGRFPGYAIPMCLCSALVSGVLIGGVYGIVDLYVPSIYLAVFLAVATGGVVGAMSGLTIRRAKVRNQPLAVALGLFAGAAAWYGAWIGWIYAYSEWTYLTADPVELWDVGSFLMEQGVWEFSGNVVRGGVLGAVWGIELLIFLGASAWLGRHWINKQPFNEKANAWVTQTKPLPITQYITERQAKEIKDQLTRGDFDWINSLHAVSLDESRYSRLCFRWAEDDEDTVFMSLVSVIETIDDQGQVKTAEFSVARDMVMDSESKDLLVQIVTESVQQRNLAHEYADDNDNAETQGGSDEEDETSEQR